MQSCKQVAIRIVNYRFRLLYLSPETTSTLCKAQFGSASEMGTASALIQVIWACHRMPAKGGFCARLLYPLEY